jgi:signal peptidase I
MTDASDGAPGAPWESLWLHPGDAIDSILSRGSQRRTLVLAAVLSALTGLVAIDLPLHVLGNTHADGAWTVLLVTIVASAIFGVAAYYPVGFVTNIVARALGGHGKASATRAALIWGAAPSLISLTIVVIDAIAFGEPGKGWPNILLDLVKVVGGIWSLVLVIAMLARVQTFRAWRAFLSWFAGFVTTTCVALLCTDFVIRPFYVPSSNMSPTLMAGDYVFVSRWDYRTFFSRAPQRGDIVVFSPPWIDAPFMERVVGLPGDKIQIVRAHLLINGQPVERRTIKPDLIFADRYGKPKPVATYEEVLPDGPTHRIIQIGGDDGLLSNTQVFETPPDSLFVMGDNRDNSNDSRIPVDNEGVGFVPIASVAGRVRYIYYSVDGDHRDNPPPRLGRVGLTVE